MTDRPILSLLNRLLILALALVTSAGFFLVPLETSLPIHWNINGQPDGFAPAAVALLLPAIMGAFVLGLFYVIRPAGLRQDFEAGRHLIAASISLILALAIVISGATVAFGVGLTVDMPRLIGFIIGAMLLVLGNYLPKTQPNWIAGVRLPWTLRDPANWRITNRWTGRLMMLGGAVALVAAAINPAPATLLVTVLASVFVPTLAGILISYRIARRQA